MAEYTTIVLDPDEQAPPGQPAAPHSPSLLTTPQFSAPLSREVLDTCLDELQALWQRQLPQSGRDAWWSVLKDYKTNEVRRAFRTLFQTEGADEHSFSRFPKPGQLVALIRNAELASRHDDWERLAAEVPYCARCGSSGMVTVWAVGKPPKRFWVPVGPLRDEAELPENYAWDNERLWSFAAKCSCPHGERRGQQFGWMRPYTHYVQLERERTR